MEASSQYGNGSLTFSNTYTAKNHHANNYSYQPSLAASLNNNMTQQQQQNEAFLMMTQIYRPDLKKVITEWEQKQENEEKERQESTIQTNNKNKNNKRKEIPSIADTYIGSCIALTQLQQKELQEVIREKNLLSRNNGNTHQQQQNNNNISLSLSQSSGLFNQHHHHDTANNSSSPSTTTTTSLNYFKCNQHVVIELQRTEESAIKFHAALQKESESDLLMFGSAVSMIKQQKQHRQRLRAASTVSTGGGTASSTKKDLLRAQQHQIAMLLEQHQQFQKSQHESSFNLGRNNNDNNNHESSTPVVPNIGGVKKVQSLFASATASPKEEELGALNNNNNNKKNLGNTNTNGRTPSFHSFFNQQQQQQEAATAAAATRTNTNSRINNNISKSNSPIYNNNTDTNTPNNNNNDNTNDIFFHPDTTFSLSKTYISPLGGLLPLIPVFCIPRWFDLMTAFDFTGCGLDDTALHELSVVFAQNHERRIREHEERFGVVHSTSGGGGGSFPPSPFDRSRNQSPLQQQGQYQNQNQNQFDGTSVAGASSFNNNINGSIFSGSTTRGLNGSMSNNIAVAVPPYFSPIIAISLDNNNLTMRAADDLRRLRRSIAPCAYFSVKNNPGLLSSLVENLAKPVQQQQQKSTSKSGNATRRNSDMAGMMETNNNINNNSNNNSNINREDSSNQQQRQQHHHHSQDSPIPVLSNVQSVDELVDLFSNNNNNNNNNKNKNITNDNPKEASTTAAAANNNNNNPSTTGQRNRASSIIFEENPSPNNNKNNNSDNNSRTPSPETHSNQRNRGSSVTSVSMNGGYRNPNYAQTIISGGGGSGTTRLTQRRKLREIEEAKKKQQEQERKELELLNLQAYQQRRAILARRTQQTNCLSFSIENPGPRYFPIPSPLNGGWLTIGCLFSLPTFGCHIEREVCLQVTRRVNRVLRTSKICIVPVFLGDIEEKILLERAEQDKKKERARREEEVERRKKQMMKNAAKLMSLARRRRNRRSASSSVDSYNNNNNRNSLASLTSITTYENDDDDNDDDDVSEDNDDDEDLHEEEFTNVNNNNMSSSSSSDQYYDTELTDKVNRHILAQDAFLQLGVSIVVTIATEHCSPHQLAHWNFAESNSLFGQRRTAASVVIPMLFRRSLSGLPRVFRSSKDQTSVYREICDRAGQHFSSFGANCFVHDYQGEYQGIDKNGVLKVRLVDENKDASPTSRGGGGNNLAHFIHLMSSDLLAAAGKLKELSHKRADSRSYAALSRCGECYFAPSQFTSSSQQQQQTSSSSIGSSNETSALFSQSVSKFTSSFSIFDENSSSSMTSSSKHKKHSRIVDDMKNTSNNNNNNNSPKRRSSSVVLSLRNATVEHNNSINDNSSSSQPQPPSGIDPQRRRSSTFSLTPHDLKQLAVASSSTKQEQQDDDVENNNSNNTGRRSTLSRSSSDHDNDDDGVSSVRSSFSPTKSGGGRNLDTMSQRSRGSSAGTARRSLGGGTAVTSSLRRRNSFGNNGASGNNSRDNASNFDFLIQQRKQQVLQHQMRSSGILLQELLSNSMIDVVLLQDDPTVMGTMKLTALERSNNNSDGILSIQCRQVFPRTIGALRETLWLAAKLPRESLPVFVPTPVADQQKESLSRKSSSYNFQQQLKRKLSQKRTRFVSEEGQQQHDDDEDVEEEEESEEEKEKNLILDTQTGQFAAMFAKVLSLSSSIRFIILFDLDCLIRNTTIGTNPSSNNNNNDDNSPTATTKSVVTFLYQFSRILKDAGLRVLCIMDSAAASASSGSLSTWRMRHYSSLATSTLHVLDQSKNKMSNLEAVLMGPVMSAASSSSSSSSSSKHQQLSDKLMEYWTRKYPKIVKMLSTVLSTSKSMIVAKLLATFVCPSQARLMQLQDQIVASSSSLVGGGGGSSAFRRRRLLSLRRSNSIMMTSNNIGEFFDNNNTGDASMINAITKRINPALLTPEGTKRLSAFVDAKIKKELSMMKKKQRNDDHNADDAVTTALFWQQPSSSSSPAAAEETSAEKEEQEKQFILRTINYFLRHEMDCAINKRDDNFLSSSQKKNNQDDVDVGGERISTFLHSILDQHDTGMSFLALKFGLVSAKDHQKLHQSSSGNSNSNKDDESPPAPQQRDRHQRDFAFREFFFAPRMCSHHHEKSNEDEEIISFLAEFATLLDWTQFFEYGLWASPIALATSSLEKFFSLDDNSTRTTMPSPKHNKNQQPISSYHHQHHQQQQKRNFSLAPVARLDSLRVNDHGAYPLSLQFLDALEEEDLQVPYGLLSESGLARVSKAQLLNRLRNKLEHVILSDPSSKHYNALQLILSYSGNQWKKNNNNDDDTNEKEADHHHHHLSSSPPPPPSHKQCPPFCRICSYFELLNKYRALLLTRANHLLTTFVDLDSHSPENAFYNDRYWALVQYAVDCKESNTTQAFQPHTRCPVRLVVPRSVNTINLMKTFQNIFNLHNMNNNNNNMNIPGGGNNSSNNSSLRRLRSGSTISNFCYHQHHQQQQNDNNSVDVSPDMTMMNTTATDPQQQLQHHPYQKSSDDLLNSTVVTNSENQQTHNDQLFTPTSALSSAAAAAAAAHVTAAAPNNNLLLAITPSSASPPPFTTGFAASINNTNNNNNNNPNASSSSSSPTPSSSFNPSRSGVGRNNNDASSSSSTNNSTRYLQFIPTDELMFCFLRRKLPSSSMLLSPFILQGQLVLFRPLDSTPSAAIRTHKQCISDVVQIPQTPTNCPPENHVRLCVSSCSEGMIVIVDCKIEYEYEEVKLSEMMKNKKKGNAHNWSRKNQRVVDSSSSSSSSDNDNDDDKDNHHHQHPTRYSASKETQITLPNAPGAGGGDGGGHHPDGDHVASSSSSFSEDLSTTTTTTLSATARGINLAAAMQQQQEQDRSDPKKITLKKKTTKIKNCVLSILYKYQLDDVPAALTSVSLGNTIVIGGALRPPLAVCGIDSSINVCGVSMQLGAKTDWNLFPSVTRRVMFTRFFHEDLMLCTVDVVGTLMIWGGCDSPAPGLVLHSVPLGAAPLKVVPHPLLDDEITVVMPTRLVSIELAANIHIFDELEIPMSTSPAARINGGGTAVSSPGYPWVTVYSNLDIAWVICLNGRLSNDGMMKVVETFQPSRRVSASRTLRLQSAQTEPSTIARWNKDMVTNEKRKLSRARRTTGGGGAYHSQSRTNTNMMMMSSATSNNNDTSSLFANSYTSIAGMSAAANNNNNNNDNSFLESNTTNHYRSASRRMMNNNLSYSESATTYPLNDDNDQEESLTTPITRPPSSQSAYHLRRNGRSSNKNPSQNKNNNNTSNNQPTQQQLQLLNVLNSGRRSKHLDRVTVLKDENHHFHVICDKAGRQLVRFNCFGFPVSSEWDEAAVFEGGYVCFTNNWEIFWWKLE